MGLERERIELVAWLVEHHLIMSDFAQKRDLADPRTVTAFAKIVEDPKRMRMLLVLTVADIRAVGPGVWNGWKGQLLRELYGSTEAVFRGGRTGDPAASHARHMKGAADAARADLIAADPSAADWASSMEDAYFAGFAPAEQLGHAALARRAQADGAAAQAEVRADLNAAEVTVTTADRRRLFADLAEVLSGFGANVAGARAYTARSGRVLDVFYLQDHTGAAFGADNAKALERLTAALEAAARGEAVQSTRARSMDLGRTAAFTIAATVTVDNDASDEASVIEVSGRDRPGLLGDIADALTEAGLSIQSAHVDNYGERAVDAFYCYETSGGKLIDPRRIAGLKAVLSEVLDDTGGVAGDRPRLQRARASVAR
jgi:[protein-PII] uridylyltransferase